MRSRLGGSVIGDSDTVRAGLEDIVERTQADELMISGMFYEQSDRLRSFELIAGLQDQKRISAEA